MRQLESELHIDGQHTTVDDLRRFVPTLWHVKVRGLGLPLMMLKNGLHPFGSVLPPGCLSLSIYCQAVCGTPHPLLEPSMLSDDTATFHGHYANVCAQIQATPAASEPAPAANIQKAASLAAFFGL